MAARSLIGIASFGFALSCDAFACTLLIAAAANSPV